MAVLAGEAAIRIVPTLRGFKTRADTDLRAMRLDPVKVRIEANTAAATASLAGWRKVQEANALNIPVRIDKKSWGELRRELSTVEHVFKRSALRQAIRLNVTVLGLDAVQALAYAAGSAAAGLDALGKSALALPGILGGALASVASLAVGLRGVKDAFSAMGDHADEAASRAKATAASNRDLERSYKSYRSAVKDTIREIQDLNAENRRSSLNVADAVLSVQESAQRLREGGQQSILELRRDQLAYMQDVDRLQEVQRRAARTAEDTFEANAKGVANSDRVVDALDQIRDATERLNESTGGTTAFEKAMAALSPKARSAVDAVKSFSGAWKQLSNTVQDNLFAGVDQAIIDLGQKSLPGLELSMSRVASGLNKNFRSVAQSLGSDQNQSFLSQIFGNTEAGLNRLAKAMNPLVDGIMRLTKESSDFLPRLGDAADKVFTKFDKWTAKISADGSLDKWIDSGLDALSSLGRSAGNILSIVSSVGEAFSKAAGHEGGFVTTLENATSKLRDFLDSSKGQSTLANYFTRAKQLITDIGTAIAKMRPFVSDMVDFAREWSTWMLNIAGGFASIAGAIERNTGLMKWLLFGYLTFKTTKPIVDAMTGAWRLYNNAVQTAATSNHSPAWLKNNSFLQWTATQAQIAKGSVDALTGSLAAAQAAASTTAATAAVAAGGAARGAVGTTAALGGGGHSTLAIGQQLAAERARREAAGFGLRPDPMYANNSSLGAPPALMGTVQSALRDEKKWREGAATVPGRQENLAASQAAQRQMAEDRRRAQAAGWTGQGSPNARIDQANRAMEARSRANRRVAVERAAEREMANNRARAQAAGFVGGTPKHDTIPRSTMDRLHAQAARLQPLDYTNRTNHQLGRNLPPWNRAETRGVPALGSLNGPVDSSVRRAHIEAMRLRPLEYTNRVNQQLGSNLPSWLRAAQTPGPLNGPALPPGFIRGGGELLPSGKPRAMQGPALPPGFANRPDPSKFFQSSSPAMGAMQGPALPPNMVGRQHGPALPPGFANRADPKKFFEVKAPKLGAMEGPRLPPQFFQEVGKAADAATPKVQGAADASKDAAKQVTAVGDSAKRATPNVKGVGVSSADSGKQVGALGTAGKNTAGAVKSAGDASKTAAGQVGGLGTAASTAASQVGSGTAGGPGLWGRMAGMAGSMLGGLGFTALIMGAMAAVVKLGEAHRNAARDAKAQDDALKGLAATLDGTTGSLTSATVGDTLKAWSSPDGMALGGGVNANFMMYDALRRLNMNPIATARTAADPTQHDKFMQEQDSRIDTAARQIEQHPDYQRFKEAFAANNLDPQTIARATAGDGEAYRKFRAAEDNPATIRDDDSGVTEQARIPQLKAVSEWMNADLFGVNQILQQTHDANMAQGGLNSQLSLDQNGRRNISSTFGEYGPNRDGARVGSDGIGKFELSQEPGEEKRKLWAELYGIDVDRDADGNGLFMVTVPADLVNQVMPAFFRGGLVGGQGGPTEDNVLARVSPGEHIARAAAVKYYGADLFKRLNNMELPRFNGGGWPFMPLSPAPPVTPDPLRDLLGVGSGAAPVGGLDGMLAPGGRAANAPGIPSKAPVPDGTPLAPPLAPAPSLDTSSAPAVDVEPVAYEPGVNYVDGLPVAGTTGLNLAGTGFFPQWTPEPYGLPAGTGGSLMEIPWINQMANRFGLTAQTRAGHQEGSGFNKGIDWNGSPENLRAFAEYAKHIPGVEQLIFMDPRDGTKIGRDPGDRGANQSIEDYYNDAWAGHQNHVHTRQSQSLPTPEALQGLLAQYPGGLPGGISLDQLTSDDEDADPLGNVIEKWKNFFNPDNMKKNIKGAYAKAWEPKNAMTFLGGQAASVGSSLLGIGTQFLSGITGINFDAILGPGQQLGNHALGMLGGEGSSGAGSLMGDGGAGTYLNQYLHGNGQMNLGTTEAGAAGPQGDFNPNLMKQVFPHLYGKGRKGGNAYRPMIRKALEKYGPHLGITNTKAWEDALVKQIDTESSGDPTAFNGSDSNGRGGTQTVSGLLQFLNTTYDAHNITGLPQGDPYGQIAAALPYVKERWGMDKDGAPLQIGRGKGYAKGGHPAGGLAWLSSGEFRTNPAATQHYGSGLYDALNSMSIPREQMLGGFNGGGFPIPLPSMQPPAGQAAGPLDLGTPPVEPVAPLPVPGAVSAAPSTGGAPGPGATAPAPNPGALPGVQDAMTNIGGLGAAFGGGSSVGSAQPGASASSGTDARSTLGAAPTKSSHVHPALASGISGAAGTIGSLASMAATMGAGAAAPGAGGAAGAGVQAGAQMIGGLITGGANILSSLLVGTATNGSTASASGVPMLPQQPQTTGVRPNVQGKVHNGDNHYHLTNLDEFKRQQATTAAQDAMPFIGKY